MPDRPDADLRGFREHCRRWLAGSLPDAPPHPLPRSPLEIADREQLDFLVRWQAAAHAAGLVGADYPEAYGGGGRTRSQRVANEEMTAAGAPILPNIVGLGMAAPTILMHGTEEQKRSLIPGILSGADIWCQGFSEPGAGSDLANVSTSAVRKGDGWVVSGCKVWTSLAGFAGWMLLLARTDPSDKYGGLTYFVAPIAAGVASGAVKLRPLVKMTGERGFFEVQLEDLVVEDRWRLDEVGAGWKVAMTTLTHERGASGLVTPRSGGGESSAGTHADELVALAREVGLTDPVLRDRVVALLVRQRAFDRAPERAQVSALTDHPERMPLQHKLEDSELRQAVAALGCTLLGMQRTKAGAWPMSHMGSYGYTIAAGTSEVQRNILGERVLGLAKSR